MATSRDYKNQTNSVIFLDIDEVLCGLLSALTNNSKIPFFKLDNLTKEYFNLEPLRLIKVLKELSGSDIVLSSTWRMNIKGVYDRLYLEKILGFEISGLTGYDSTGFRGHEIQKYVLDNNVKNYVIIDDSSDFHEFQLEKFVHVKMYKGFDMDNFLDACKILNVKDNRVNALLKNREYYLNRNSNYE